MRYIGRLLSSLLLVVTSVVSCQKSEVTGDIRTPMSFSSEDTKAGIYNTHESFKVWATRVADANTTLMGGYRVNYVETQWTYTEGTGTESQGMRYWDTGATSFRFHAGAPYSAVSNMTADGLSLSMSATDAINNTALYSSPKVVLPSTFGDNVLLEFNQASSRIEIAFVNDSSADKELTGITLTPSGTYGSAGQLDVSYDWSTSPASASLSINASAQASAALTFADVSLPTGSAGSVFSASTWYMIPEATTDRSSSSQWTISFEDGDIHREASFAQGKEWRPGYSYKYVFTIGEDTMELNLITIADWDKVDINVNTEQISYQIEVETTEWGQDNKYVHSFEFVNLYSEGGEDVFWAACGLNSLLYYDNSLLYTWNDVTPDDPSDEDYLSSYFKDNTGFKWQTPTRDDFTALLSGDNTDIEMVKDPETKVFGLVVKSKTLATRSIFLPNTEAEQIESAFEETKTRVTRTYMGSYWTRDSFDGDSAYKMKYAFTQVETRTPDGAGGYISDFSSFEKAGASLFAFEAVPKTTKLPVRPLVKITK